MRESAESIGFIGFSSISLYILLESTAHIIELTTFMVEYIKGNLCIVISVCRVHNLNENHTLIEGKAEKNERSCGKKC